MLHHLCSANPADKCLFGSTATARNAYFKQIALEPQGAPGGADPQQYPMSQVAGYLRDNALGLTSPHQAFLSFLFNDSRNIDGSNPNLPNFTTNYTYGDAPAQFFSVRTCNSYWNPDVTIRASNLDPFFLGMSSQRTEREDFVVTQDLQGSVSDLLITYGEHNFINGIVSAYVINFPVRAIEM